MKKTMLVALVIVSLIFGIVAYASAASASANVAVTVKVNPKLNLTVVPAAGADLSGSQALGFALDWTGVDPGTSKSKAVAFTIDSNRAGNLTAVWSSDPSAYNLSSTLQASPEPFGKGTGQPFGDTISFAPDWNTDTVGMPTYTLQYSAIQS